MPFPRAGGPYGARVRLLCLVFLCWWSTAVLVAEDTTRTWTIPKVGLGLVVPATWTGVTDHAGAALVLRSGLPAGKSGDAAERARGIIAVALQAVKDEGPLAFAVRCRRDLERTAAGLALGTAGDLVLGGRSWTKQPYRMQVGQFTFAQVSYATVIDGTGICVTCSCIDDGFTQWQTAFDAAIASLGRSRITIDLK